MKIMFHIFVPAHLCFVVCRFSLSQAKKTILVELYDANMKQILHYFNVLL